MRRGYSLIEMVVVMTVGATMLGIAVTLLGALMQAERTGRAHIGQNGVFNRLADQFRRDVHAADGPVVAAKSKAGQPAWRFDMVKGRSVWYIPGDEEIVREERIGHILVRRESCSLPEDCCATITTDAKASPPIVRLTIAPTDASLRPGHEIRIDAVPGRDHRFVKQGVKVVRTLRVRDRQAECVSRAGGRGRHTECAAYVAPAQRENVE
jgi:prepilin-type N-terminal cleavage/methylation domain-containing protein